MSTLDMKKLRGLCNLLLRQKSEGSLKSGLGERGAAVKTADERKKP